MVGCGTKTHFPYKLCLDKALSSMAILQGICILGVWLVRILSSSRQRVLLEAACGEVKHLANC